MVFGLVNLYESLDWCSPDAEAMMKHSHVEMSQVSFEVKDRFLTFDGLAVFNGCVYILFIAVKLQGSSVRFGLEEYLL